MITTIPTIHTGSANSRMTTTRQNQRPLKICVVFDEDDSARSAEVLITHVASDYECDMQSFSFDELSGPKPGVAAARKTADTDVLVLAARGDRSLPSHVRVWLGLCLGMRDEGREGALVALIDKVAGMGSLRTSLLEYLETVAIIGGLAFFPPPQGPKALPFGKEQYLLPSKTVEVTEARWR